MSTQHRNSHDVRKSRAAWVVALAVAAMVMLPAAPAEAVKREFFGVVPVSTPSAEEFGLMSSGKVGTYRFQLSWAIVQPAEGGAYDWSEPDARVGRAVARGLEVLPFLYGTPSYAASDPRKPPLGAKKLWKRFLRAAAERYGPGGDFWSTFQSTHPGAKPKPIKVWQIGNEQNSPTFFKPKPSPKRYGKLVKISSKALQSVHKKADILLGGMFGTPSRKKAVNAWTFLKRLFRIKGAKRHIDAVGLHPYSPNLRGIKVQIRKARKQIRKHGQRKTPIWITELGWGSAGTKGHPLVKSRKGQKKMLKKSFEQIMKRKGKWKIRRLLWFAWRDPAGGTDAAGTLCTFCTSAGLFDQDLDPKPSWNQFRKLTGAK